MFFMGMISLCQSVMAQESLLDKRAGFTTSIVDKVRQSGSLEEPPIGHLFQLIKYETGIGKMSETAFRRATK